MTREEAKKLFHKDNSKAYDVINEIYDDFESRTCESCKFFKIIAHNPMGISAQPVPTCIMTNRVKYSNGFCDEWESK